MRKRSPNLAERKIKIIIPSTKTYLDETGFSTLVNTQSKVRNRLCGVDDMRVSFSKTIPEFHSLAEKKQNEKSH